MTDSVLPNPRNDAQFHADLWRRHDDPLQFFTSESSLTPIAVDEDVCDAAHLLGEWFDAETQVPSVDQFRTWRALATASCILALVVWSANITVIRSVPTPVTKQAVRHTQVSSLQASASPIPIEEAGTRLSASVPLSLAVDRSRHETDSPVREAIPIWRPETRPVQAVSSIVEAPAVKDTAIADTQAPEAVDVVPVADSSSVLSPTPQPEDNGVLVADAGVMTPVGTSAVVSPVVAPAQTQIESVLSGYVKAFNALDVRAAKAVWPSVDERALSRAFGGLQQQEFELGACEIDVKSGLAVAKCQGMARYVPKIGTRSVRSERRQWTFYLAHRGEDWSIHTVDAR